MIPSNLKCQTALPTEFSGRVYVIKANETYPTELSETDKIMLKNQKELCKTGDNYKLTDGTLLCNTDKKVVEK